jgi:predicted metal-dependent phosphoesterase TrpH
MKYIDLHAHTSASDGSMSPAELVRHAKEIGLTAVAITDHDTINGVEEALEEGKRIGIEVVAGLEIGVDFVPEMHLLAYFFNDNYNSINPTLQKLRQKRNERNPKIISKLNEMGFKLTLDEVKVYANGKILGRPHIAKAMVDKGYVKSANEAFNKYLARGCPAYFKKDKLSPEEGIAEILAVGGIPVLAHPIYLKRERKELLILLKSLAKAGLKGLEVYYADNTEEETEMMYELAKECGLLVTGGSDFHGTYRPDVKLGSGRGNLKLPYKLLEDLKAASI